MKKSRQFFLLILLLIVVSACGSPSGSNENNQANIPANESGAIVEDETPTEEPVPTAVDTPIPTAEPVSPPIIIYPPPSPGTVAYDFVEQICSAQWSSSISFFTCPGVSGAENSISRVDNPELANGLTVNLPALLTVPMENNGVFGRYPAFTVSPGDEIRALLACKEPSQECTVEFSIEYYKNGEFFGYPNAIFQQPIPIGPDGYHELVVPLNGLVGESVEFLLSLREQGGNKNQQGLWISPYIYRDPNAVVIAPVATNPPDQNNPSPTATPEEEKDTTPGVVSGWVDFTSSPGNVTNGQAVTVMFFNQEDFTWWWVGTAFGNSNFQMTMPPGPYVVTAYTSVSGGSISVGYTGGGQTCGSGLALVNLEPNGRVENLVVTDWCNPGSWPSRPGGVPLP
ncbi:MAG: hypothetical protein HON98_04055 [Chloroflexi bacterium]|nr:hypothetical protein [Chloroflexota bacterium]MBT3671290.1 hypothetical protein [Chloroflexota bacterium]MBT4001767.1 hypothetical protein [Chloroflexota bacterium]MBT4304251.1 hypothetical protein [Chloroflexota bacterium]MBT4534270.1 hypothetical protein [Chloroflexota bacterium]